MTWQKFLAVPVVVQTNKGSFDFVSISLHEMEYSAQDDNVKEMNKLGRPAATYAAFSNA